MSTLSHKRGKTSSATKRVTLKCDDQSELHEGNTPNVVKNMIWFLDLF